MIPAVLQLASAILTLLIEELGPDTPNIASAAMKIADYTKSLFAVASGDTAPSDAGVQASDITILVNALKQEILSEADSAAEGARVQSQVTAESVTLAPKKETSS